MAKAAAKKSSDNASKLTDNVVKELERLGVEKLSKIRITDRFTPEIREQMPAPLKELYFGWNWPEGVIFEANLEDTSVTDEAEEIIGNQEVEFCSENEAEYYDLDTLTPSLDDILEERENAVYLQLAIGDGGDFVFAIPLYNDTPNDPTVIMVENDNKDEEFFCVEEFEISLPLSRFLKLLAPSAMYYDDDEDDEDLNDYSNYDDFNDDDGDDDEDELNDLNELDNNFDEDDDFAAVDDDEDESVAELPRRKRR